MNHDITKTEREDTKHLVDKARTHGGMVLQCTSSSMGEKNSNDPESELTVNRNYVTYQYTNRNVSINKLFCMYTNVDKQQA